MMEKKKRPKCGHEWKKEERKKEEFLGVMLTYLCTSIRGICTDV
jgi:hypothetical protein